MSKACANKVQYSTKPMARSAIRRVERKGRVSKGSLTVYLCSVCRRYHIGHRLRKQGLSNLRYDSETLGQLLDTIMDDIWRAIQKSREVK